MHSDCRRKVQSLWDAAGFEVRRISMTIFVCEDSLDGILTGVYDAWDSRLGHG